MLKSVNLDDKSYEELLAEAIGQIPLYTKEWTNFNRSDPGITVLQNLTAFNQLQQIQLNEVSEAVRLRLLNLLSFRQSQNRPARLFLRAHSKRPLSLPAHSSFVAGDVPFELDEPLCLAPWDIACALAVENNQARDISSLLASDVAAGALPFGKTTEAGASLWLFLNGLPAQNQPFLLWAEVASTALRNPQKEDEPLQLAKLLWETYTENGWETLQALDETHGFMQSGGIRLSPPSSACAPWQGNYGSGYVLRCTLQSAEYDLPAKLQSLSTNLFEVFQKHTCATTFYAPGASEVHLQSRLASLGNLFVYCREESASSSYRAYRQVGEDVQLTGRYFCTDIAADGSVTIRFKEDTFGHGPIAEKDAVLVICYDNSSVLNRALGQVYGYDNQILALPHLDNLLEDNFCLLAEEMDSQGEPYYYLVHPNQTDDPDVMHYTLQTGPGNVVVHRPAIGGTCYLYLAACMVSLGAGGNIRAGNRFTANACLPEPVVFESPGPSTGGTSEETSEALRTRFMHAMRNPATAVTAADYEALVKKTPGLCIHKVKALANEAKNTVIVAVKPHSSEAWPTLSAIYRKQILRHLEKRRIVNTRVVLVQPLYVDIHVKVSVQVYSYATNAQEEIEALLRKELDFAASGRDFGETVRYYHLFHGLERLDCVQSVQSFSLIPSNHAHATLDGPDIQMGFNCFARPGQLMLDITNNQT